MSFELMTLRSSVTSQTLKSDTGSWSDRKERVQEDGKGSTYKTKNGVMVKSFKFRKRMQNLLKKWALHQMEWDHLPIFT